MKRISDLFDGSQKFITVFHALSDFFENWICDIYLIPQ